jgi:hypothetical protein
MSTKNLSRKELVEQSFTCCIQAVKSYGSPLEQRHREGLITSMKHFKKLYLTAIEKENING